MALATNASSRSRVEYPGNKVKHAHSGATAAANSDIQFMRRI
jgi:Holliday junction resolvasome RuvABC endonuclease subunit